LPEVVAGLYIEIAECEHIVDARSIV